jgi:hypothetical protein
MSPGTQDFSDSNEDFLDNFADGPDPNDDGTPVGLGGERGKQVEPASSTLEADIANGTTKQSGEKLPSDEPVGEPQPVQKPASDEGTETSPEPTTGEPETPEFPPALLQMAGYVDAEAAQAAGFQDPAALLAAIRWRGQLLSPSAQPAQLPLSSEQGLYRRSAQQPAPTAPPAPTEPAQETETEDFKAYQLSDDRREMLEEELVTVLDEMNQHYQQELKSLRSSVGKRESDLVRQQEQEEEAAFDKAVQDLGEEWQDVFGEGGGADLARTGQRDPVAMTNYNHRALLFETVEAVREVNARQGYKPMALEQEVQWALLQRYPDKFEQTISGNSNSNSNGSADGSGQGRGATAGRPMQRSRSPKTQDERSISAVNAMLKKRHGYSLEMGQEEEFEGEI